MDCTDSRTIRGFGLVKLRPEGGQVYTFTVFAWVGVVMAMIAMITTAFQAFRLRSLKVEVNGPLPPSAEDLAGNEEIDRRIRRLLRNGLIAAASAAIAMLAIGAAVAFVPLPLWGIAALVAALGYTVFYKLKRQWATYGQLKPRVRGMSAEDKAHNKDVKRQRRETIVKAVKATGLTGIVITALIWAWVWRGEFLPWWVELVILALSLAALSVPLPFSGLETPDWLVSEPDDPWWSRVLRAPFRVLADVVTWVARQGRSHAVVKTAVIVAIVVALAWWTTRGEADKKDAIRYAKVACQTVNPLVGPEKRDIAVIGLKVCKDTDNDKVGEWVDYTGGSLGSVKVIAQGEGQDTEGPFCAQEIETAKNGSVVVQERGRCQNDAVRSSGATSTSAPEPHCDGWQAQTLDTPIDRKVTTVTGWWSCRASGNWRPVTRSPGDITIIALGPSEGGWCTMHYLMRGGDLRNIVRWPQPAGASCTVNSLR